MSAESPPFFLSAAFLAPAGDVGYRDIETGHPRSAPMCLDPVQRGPQGPVVVPQRTARARRDLRGCYAPPWTTLWPMT